MNTRNRAWQYLEKLFEYCIKENRCPDLLAYLFDKQQFKKILAGHEKSSIEEAYTHFVNTIIGKINGKLFFGGNELAVIGDTFYIKKHGDSVKVQTPRILRNKMNLGYARNSNMELPYLEHLQIIDEITFDRAQFILDQRSKVDNEKRTIARQSKSKNMLSGIMFCGHCGHRLTSLVYHEKYIRRDGSIYDRKQLKYLCYHKSRGLCKCDGQSTYVAERVDNAIIAYIHKMFQNIKNSPDEAELKKSIERSAAESKAAQDLLNLELQKNSDQLITLHNQVSATLNGDGVYTTEQLSTAIRTVEARIYSIRDKIEELQSEVDYKRESLDQMKPMFEQLLSWAQAFDNSSIAQKKMIISQMLSSIKLYKDYKIVIELNEDYKYLCENWDNLAAETTIYA